ncbi:MAG: hypothetical protein LBD90_04695 [Bifidobacteriaceae bacterium]|nr:hypothetical protein [Bifidobacteriaceae bacterium]
MKAVALDAEAVNLLAERRDRPSLRKVQAALAAAYEERSRVVVAAAALAEPYRGGGWDQRLDSVLARQRGIEVVATDRPLARVVGRLLASAGLGSEHHVDATVVAACLTVGGGLVLTSDPDDLGRLAASAPTVVVDTI